MKKTTLKNDILQILFTVSAMICFLSATYIFFYVLWTMHPLLFISVFSFIMATILYNNIDL